MAHNWQLRDKTLILNPLIDYLILQNFLIAVSDERKELYRHDISNPGDYNTTSLSIGDIYDVQIYASVEQTMLECKLIFEMKSHHEGIE